ncbi:hypothetical protein EYF80_054058 [Liparis tanakae]|uniref:Uncharacterized protein n=1 Tax=Liparis tanakae TaxID=230148 RepID=A0A4Z2F3Y3_9TELE|nr:hypothetical protein EYF80_054058 [Liparis tanakae]
MTSEASLPRLYHVTASGSGVLVDLGVKVQHRWVQSDDVIFPDAVGLLVVQVQQEVLLGHADVHGGAGQAHGLLDDAVCTENPGHHLLLPDVLTAGGWRPVAVGDRVFLPITGMLSSCSRVRVRVGLPGSTVSPEASRMPCTSRRACFMASGLLSAERTLYSLFTHSSICLHWNVTDGSPDQVEEAPEGGRQRVGLRGPEQGHVGAGLAQVVEAALEDVDGQAGHQRREDLVKLFEVLQSVEHQGFLRRLPGLAPVLPELLAEQSQVARLEHHLVGSETEGNTLQHDNRLHPTARCESWGSIRTGPLYLDYLSTLR